MVTLYIDEQIKSKPNPHQVDTTLDASLRELLARITPLCSHYSNVVQFCEDQSHPAGTAGATVGPGRVNQALAGALYSLIKDYYIFVTQVGYSYGIFIRIGLWPMAIFIYSMLNNYEYLNFCNI